ncbi:MAG: phage portal protein [Aestuariibacter sp.]|nr:phage portal protein [Aestuariibacter sp.]
MAKVVPIQARYEAGYYSDYNPTPPASRGADAEIYSAGAKLRDWARYLAKNSAIVKAVLDARCAKGVGTGLTYEPMVRDKKGNLLPKLNDAIRRHHEKWSESVDTTSEMSRQEAERITWREWDTVGEIFARKVFRGRTRDRIGYQIQLIKSELVPYGFMHDTSPTMGIDRDEWGAPTNYWTYPYNQHADMWQWQMADYKPVAIPAEFVCHLRRQEELGATRGVTLFHAVIFRASDIAEFQQSHRRAARASANLFASINRDADMGADTASSAEDINLLDLQIIDFLKSGESVNFHDPSHPNQNAVEFVNQELRQFAAACRVAFSWIAFVFDKAYAAQRTELVHAWELINEDRAQFIRDFARPALYAKPLRTAILEGKIIPNLLRKADQSTLYDVRIEGPVMPQIDPVKDKQSAKLDQDNGWESRHGNIRKFGRNPSQVDAERNVDTFVPLEAMMPAEEKQDEDDDDE